MQLVSIGLEQGLADTFYCDPEQEPYVTPEGWFEMLREFVHASAVTEGDDLSWSLLWLYVPDFTQQGTMQTIQMIPKYGNIYDLNDPNPYWKQDDNCAGFAVSDDCQWRFEEMQLVTFTPDVCTNGSIVGCEYLVAYARININSATVEQAYLQFSTTIFTCIVLTIAFMVFSHDTEYIVIRPIKKVVEIIQKLAEHPLKRPEQPVQKQEVGLQMKT